LNFDGPLLKKKKKTLDQSKSSREKVTRGYGEKANGLYEKCKMKELLCIQLALHIM
jgi:hypothetical protein